ncbi:MAG TPA: ABC transporter ATP-binding protein [Vicinamibacterales bacterium]|nr:ABC transporter ATP-binding protein [Vicinamibacterales bacterium]
MPDLPARAARPEGAPVVSPLASIADVTFGYPRRAAGAPPVLDRVSLQIARGDLVGILGPNGSGKTTLLKILSGMLAPHSGRVTLDGRPLTTYTRRQIARRLAVVPQETYAAFDYSVLDVVLMGRYPHLGAFELEQADDLAVAHAALAATGTGALAHRRFGTLSGGERQRVIIASALAQSPDLLLLDEPTASLDIGAQLEIAGLLASLNRDHGLTIVLSTHDLNFAGSLCRTLVLLARGRVVAGGETAAVLTPAAIRALYGVEADVRFHEAAHHLTVTPIASAHRPRDRSADVDRDALKAPRPR